MIRVRAGERRDDVANAIELEEDAEFAVARAAVVADGENVARAFAGERLDQIVGEAGAAEAAEHHARAVGNVGDGGVDVGEDFLFHSGSELSSMLSRLVRGVL